MMEADRPANFAQLASALESSRSGEQFRSRFEEAFDCPTSTGLLLYDWSFIQQDGANQWLECPNVVLAPNDLEEDSETPPTIGDSLLIGVLDIDQPIVVDFRCEPPSVRALVSYGRGVAWRTLAPNIDGFLDSLEIDH